MQSFQNLGEWNENGARMPRAVDVISSDWDDSGSGDSTDWSDKAYLLQSGIVKTMLALLFYDVFIGRRTKLISDVMAIYRESQPVDEILYSPLSRAADTAKIISDMTGVPCREESRLREQNFGKWESTPRDGVDFKKAKEAFACRYEGGESMLQLAQRIYNLLDEIKEESDQKTYILVAHNGIARMVQSYFQDMTNEEFASFGIKNCQVVRYDF